VSGPGRHPPRGPRPVRADPAGRLLWLAGALIAAAVACGSPDPCGDVAVCEPGEGCFPEGCDVAARCATGAEARLYGRVAAVDAGCAPLDDAACARSEVTCALWGQCRAAPEGWQPAAPCPPADADRDYQASRIRGCAGRHTCIAGSDEECARARVCSLEGRCVATDGVCVATGDDACRRSELCAQLGRCSERGGLCWAASAADCHEAVTCVERGDCGAARGRCVACRLSEDCRAAGRCDLVEGRCRATSDAMCQRSLACQQEGRCQASRGECVVR